MNTLLAPDPTAAAGFVLIPPDKANFEARVGKLTNSAPIVLRNVGDVSFTNLNIETTGQYAIDIRGAESVTILNTRFSKATYRSLNLEQCKKVIIKNCFFDFVAWGAYINQATISVIAEGNWTSNIWGMNSSVTDGNQGVGIMINNSTLSQGGSVSFNLFYTKAGVGSMQDVISCHNSGGTTANPIRLKNNYINGGGPSTSSGGILCGDNGGHDIIAEGNVLINPGQYGIASMGINNQIINNKIYAKQAPYTNVGITVWQPSPTIACSNNRVTGNDVWWINAAGAHSEKWLPNKTSDVRGCVGTIDISNVWGSTAVNESMPPPAGVPIPGPIAPPVNQPPTVNAGVDAVVTLPATVTLSGTASDAEGPVTVKWTGPGTIANPNQLTTTVSGLPAGDHLFTLTVTDAGGLSATDQVKITVKDAPVPVAKTILTTKTTKVLDQFGVEMKSVTSTEKIDL